MSSAGDCVEWFGGVPEVVEAEDCFWVGEVELLEFAVEACCWGAEVGDSCGGGDSRAYEEGYAGGLAGFYEVGDCFDGGGW